MSGIFGALGLPDTDRSFIATIGQKVVYDAAQQLIEQYNAGLTAAMSVFVERETEDYKLRYKLPGNGRLQKRGNQSQAGAVKATGQWDVAFPLEDFSAVIASDDVTRAYMTVEEFNRQLNTVFIQDRNAVRHEILKALFNNTARTFIDPLWGSLTVQPLANGDGTLYPPVEGSETEADDTHHLESGYASASISTTNNPLVTLRDELEEHFGGGASGGSNIVVFCNQAQTSILSGLADFARVKQNYVAEGDNTAIAERVATLPGKNIGYGYGVFLNEWRWIPANYLLAIHLDAPKPLMVRVDPANTGLGRGLQLVSSDTEHPFESAFYRHRFGVGVGNRLNGVVMELGTGGSYTIPTTFA